jgi:hypothetical protein
MNKKFMAISILVLFLTSISVNSCTSNVIFNTTNLYENPPTVKWECNFGGELRDYGMDILQTDDSGFITAGNYDEGDYGWILKTDAYGNVEFDKKYSNGIISHFRKILETNNGYILGGTCYPNEENIHELWVVKIDKFGNEIMSKSYGHIYYMDLFLDFTYSQDNNIILLGNTQAGNDDSSPFFVKIDQNGNEIKRVIYDRYSYDRTEDTHLFDIEPVSAGGYICSGYIQKPNSGDYDYFLLRLDEDLIEMWNSTFDAGSNIDWSYSVCESINGYILVGEFYYEKSGNPYTGLYIVKTDRYGYLSKDLKYYGIKNHASAFHIENLDDGTYLVTGETGEHLFGNFYDLLVLKIDDNLNEIWSFSHGGEYDDDGSRTKKTNDGGLIVIGTKTTDWSYFSSDEDLWIVKLTFEQTDFKPRTPSGTTSGQTGVEYTYTTSVNHPNNLDVQFGWDWDEGQEIEWTDFVSSGQTASANHVWSSDGFYIVRVKARDEYGFESEWSDPLSITMPKEKLALSNILNKIFNCLQSINLLLLN